MAGEEGLKVVGFWVSPFVARVKWALRMKGLEYEYIEEDIFNKTPLLSQLNPVHAKVPVLVHNGKPLAESLIILEYIDETWNHNYPLLPADPYERARARFWAGFAEFKILNPSWEALWSKGKQQESAVNSAMEALEKLEAELNGKQFFGGEKIGYLDLVVGWVAHNLPIFEEVASVKIFDSQKFLAIAEWKNRFLNHPIIKPDLPDTDKAYAYFDKRSKELAASFYSAN
nr:glutathione transferase GST 23-like [Ipomoea batatas]GME11466.1 glutathione transferase GST 23-like [Ipomoea batatas]